MISSLKLRWPLDYLVVLQTNKKLVKFQKSCPINKKSPLCKGLHSLLTNSTGFLNSCIMKRQKDDFVLSNTFEALSAFFSFIYIPLYGIIYLLDRM